MPHSCGSKSFPLISTRMIPLLVDMAHRFAQTNLLNHQNVRYCSVGLFAHCGPVRHLTHFDWILMISMGLLVGLVLYDGADRPFYSFALLGWGPIFCGVSPSFSVFVIFDNPLVLASSPRALGLWPRMNSGGTTPRQRGRDVWGRPVRNHLLREDNRTRRVPAYPKRRPIRVHRARPALIRHVPSTTRLDVFCYRSRIAEYWITTMRFAPTTPPRLNARLVLRLSYPISHGRLFIHRSEMRGRAVSAYIQPRLQQLKFFAKWIYKHNVPILPLSLTNCVWVPPLPNCVYPALLSSNGRAAFKRRSTTCAPEYFPRGDGCGDGACPSY